MRLLTVTAGAAQVHGGDCTAPDRALAHGLARIAHAEQPGTSWRGIDLDPSAPAGDSAAQLAEEIGHRSWEPADPATVPALIAWRRGRRLLKDWRLVPLPATDAAPFPVRPDGAYLITGGTRGLGLGLARNSSAPARANWPWSAGPTCAPRRRPTPRGGPREVCATSPRWRPRAPRCCC